MARSQDGITAPFSDPVYLKAAVLDPAFSLLWVEPHVLVNRDIKAEVAQQVKELILQDAAETEQPVLLGDEEDLGEGEGLFGAYRKRQKKDVGTSPALQLILEEDEEDFPSTRADVFYHHNINSSREKLFQALSPK
uniref:Uncharacterized protein n=1 Tax=Knipowitschia caucasica TaxID=637954 RepID=A0AAV2IRU1_KNICA